jgi:hypothetical protein
MMARRGAGGKLKSSVVHTAARRVYRMGVDHDPDRDLPCPRCRYNLRGLTTPRCPECGLSFDDESWRAGVLRDSQPTQIERCDPWQIHQVLWAGLVELIRGDFQRWRLFRGTNLGGPWWRIGLLAVAELFWLYVLVSAAATVAILAHTTASPAAAMRAALWCWAPRVVGLALLAAAGPFGLWVSAQRLRVVRLRFGAVLGLACRALPALGLNILLPMIVLLAWPDLLPGTGVWGTLPWIGAAVGISPASFVLLRRDPTAWRAELLRWLLCLGGWAASWWASHLLPTTLEPPVWVYF